ncbi:MAG: hypothetical protein ABI851_14790 [Saprospiraceae bacterium]
MKILPISILAVALFYYFNSTEAYSAPDSYSSYDSFAQDTLKDSCDNPYNFHLYIVLRKKHYHALLLVKDTLDKILLSKDIDSLQIGRNFFNIPTEKKLPPVVKWEISSGDFRKKGRMVIH